MPVQHAVRDGFVPKERYLSPDFAALELERMWGRVWQIAGRCEEIASPGDFLEYTIGEQSLLVVRQADGALRAFHNACLHRGRRLRSGVGALTEPFACPYHGWCYAHDGALAQVVDRADFGDLPDDLHLADALVDTFGGFVFVNLDMRAEPLLDFLHPLPELLAPYHLEQMRFRSHLSTILPANWKVVVDAFNEAYHVQSTHPQLLPWTDDTSIAYEQFDRHAHYGRLAQARRELRPSPRLGAVDYDEGEILASLVDGLGGAFLGDERALVDEVRAAPLVEGETLLAAYQRKRRGLLEARGLDVSAFRDDELTSADDVYCFPNVVGPIYPGSAILFRVRPLGNNPDACIKDTWVLESPRPDAPERPLGRKHYDNWRDRDWGEVTNQDYENMGPVQEGMKSNGFTGLRLNPRQEGNLLLMHRVIDRYLAD